MFCLELWRCALNEHCSFAWQHLITCFGPTLARKLARSTLAQVVIRRRTRSATRQQAERSLIEDAFAQMAAGNERRPLEARNLGSLVDFLWICAQNLMRMELRMREEPSLPAPGALPAPKVTRSAGDNQPLPALSPAAEPSDPFDLSGLVEAREALAQAALLMRGCAADERQYRAGKLLIFWQYTAEEIVAGKVARSETYRDNFSDVTELYRIKARLLKCMREHLDPPRNG
jgi:hypothetical protein